MGKETETICRLYDENEKLRRENSALRPLVSELKHKVHTLEKKSEEDHGHPMPE